MIYGVKTYVRSSFDDPANPNPGTLICGEEDIVEQQVVTGIAYSKDEAQITLRRVADKPGVAAAIFVPLAEANINVDMIVQNISEGGKFTDMTFTVPQAEFERAKAVVETARSRQRWMWPRFPPSASACAAMRASPLPASRRWPRKASTSARSRHPRSRFQC
jgi:aspartate kinase